MEDPRGPVRQNLESKKGFPDPFIQGLIKTLPEAESSWPVEKRAQWLQAAVSVFNLIYKDDSGGSIEVKVQKVSVQ